MRRLFWTLEAIQDREEIYNYIEADNKVAAMALDELFQEKAQLLVDHSEMGKLGREAGTSELVIHPNYTLVYDVIDDSVRVLRLLHTAKQWPSR